MICPNCGEDNSSNFKFCGMCGTSLEERRPVGAPRVVSSAAGNSSEAGRQHEPESRTFARATTATDRSVPPTSGPSFLGLNEPFTDDADRASTSRDQTFFGSDSFFEADEPNIGARRVVLLLVLLGVLGAGGWWAYTHYNKIGAIIATYSGTNSQTSATKPVGTETAANNPVPNQKLSNQSSNQKSTTEPVAPSSSEATPSQPAAIPPAQSGAAESKASNTAPAASEKSSDENATQTPPALAKPAEPSRPSRTQNVVHARRNDQGEARNAATPLPKATPVADDKGTVEFQKGEAYLYGRGMPENCDQAIRNLKEASAKQNAKARSAFGTMYATGHCVPRDLPTSYSWFALALRADPNNQILEKDLTAVWNQMTPPERQLAIKTKQ